MKSTLPKPTRPRPSPIARVCRKSEQRGREESEAIGRWSSSCEGNPAAGPTGIYPNVASPCNSWLNAKQAIQRLLGAVAEKSRPALILLTTTPNSSTTRSIPPRLRPFLTDHAPFFLPVLCAASTPRLSIVLVPEVRRLKQLSFGGGVLLTEFYSLALLVCGRHGRSTLQRQRADRSMQNS